MTAEPGRYDLIFMDIIMPVLDGISATTYIRSVNQQVPIIAMTSNIRAEDMAIYYQWGKICPSLDETRLTDDAL